MLVVVALICCVGLGSVIAWYITQDHYERKIAALKQSKQPREPDPVEKRGRGW